MEGDEYEDDFEAGTETYHPFPPDFESKTRDSAPSPPFGHKKSVKSRDAILEILGEEQNEEGMERIEEHLRYPSAENLQSSLKKEQRENSELRLQLKQLSEQLDRILEQKINKAAKAPLSAPSQNSDQQLRTALKKLQTVKKDRDKLYEKLKRLVDPTYSAALSQSVEELTKKLDRLQRQNRTKSQGQRGREKSLERLSKEDEVSAAMKAVIEEKANMRVLREKVGNIEEEIERIATTLVSLEEKEEKLLGKLSELQEEAEELGVSLAGEYKKKKLSEDLLAAKEACKRELGAAVLSTDTQVKKLRRKEADLTSELQAHHEELRRLDQELNSKQQILSDSQRNLVNLSEMTTGTEVEPLASRVMRRVRTKSREIAVQLEDNQPRSTKSSEPGMRDTKAEFRIRSRPVQTQSSKSLTGQTAPKPPLKPKIVPKLTPREVMMVEKETDPEEVENDPIDTPLKPEVTESVVEEKRVEVVPPPPPNIYEQAVEALEQPEVTVEQPEVTVDPQEDEPLFRPKNTHDSDEDSPLRDLPPVLPRNRSHLFSQEEASNPPPVKGVMERKYIKQRGVTETSSGRTDELAKKAEERHTFFDEEETNEFAEVQKQLVAVRSEQREPATQQVVVQYRLRTELLEEDLV